MSMWDVMDKAFLMPGIYTSRGEASVVEEALTHVLHQRLAEGTSAWALLENLPIPGFSPGEVNVMKQSTRGAAAAPTKAGNSGQIVVLDPRAWKEVATVFQQDPGYWDNRLQNFGSSLSQLMGKIQPKLQMAMGQAGAVGNMRPPAGPDLSGKPSDPTPTTHSKNTQFNDEPDTMDYPTQFNSRPPSGGGEEKRSSRAMARPHSEYQMDEPKSSSAGEPFSGDPKTSSAGEPFSGDPKTSRKASVDAQDREGMKGSKTSRMTVQDPSKQSKTDDMEDPQSWGLENEGFGNFMKGAMAGGMLAATPFSAQAGDHKPPTLQQQQGMPQQAQQNLQMVQQALNAPGNKPGDLAAMMGLQPGKPQQIVKMDPNAAKDAGKKNEAHGDRAERKGHGYTNRETSKLDKFDGGKYSKIPPARDEIELGRSENDVSPGEMMSDYNAADFENYLRGLEKYNTGQGPHPFGDPYDFYDNLEDKERNG